MILFGVPALRRLSRALLSAPLAPEKKKEVTLVLVLMLVTACAALGAVALWWWSTGGEPALARRVGGFQVPDPWSRVFSARGIVTTFVVGAVLAPFFEELVFRGILFPACRSDWDGLEAPLRRRRLCDHSSVCHPQFFTSIAWFAYTEDWLLWACIIALALHLLIGTRSLANFYFPGQARRRVRFLLVRSLGLPCVAFFAIPTYMWMSRDAKARRPCNDGHNTRRPHVARPLFGRSRNKLARPVAGAWS